MASFLGSAGGPPLAEKIPEPHRPQRVPGIHLLPGCCNGWGLILSSPPVTEDTLPCEPNIVLCVYVCVCICVVYVHVLCVCVWHVCDVCGRLCVCVLYVSVCVWCVWGMSKVYVGTYTCAYLSMCMW